MTEDRHRAMGVELNNETWRLLDQDPPGADSPLEERERFLYRAYASAYHWMETPSATPANRARAEHLVSRAATAVGVRRAALRHARRCLELCEANRDQVEDWDLAFAEEAVARALALADDLEAASEHHRRAAKLGAAISDDDDREVFLAELEKGPWFGLSDTD